MAEIEIDLCEETCKQILEIVKDRDLCVIDRVDRLRELAKALDDKESRQVLALVDHLKDKPVLPDQEFIIKAPPKFDFKHPVFKRERNDSFVMPTKKNRGRGGRFHR